MLLLLLSRFSHVQLCVTPWTAAHQAPLSLGFSRQEHWSGLPFPSPTHGSEKWKWSHSVVSDSQRPHGLQPTRLLRPWDSPGKSTGVGCHCLLWHLLWDTIKYPLAALTQSIVLSYFVSTILRSILWNKLMLFDSHTMLQVKEEKLLLILQMRKLGNRSWIRVRHRTV